MADVIIKIDLCTFNEFLQGYSIILIPIQAIECSNYISFGEIMFRLHKCEILKKLLDCWVAISISIISVVEEFYKIWKSSLKS